MNLHVSPQQAASELLRRRRGRKSLCEFAQAIDVPGKPYSDNDDEWLFHPIETSITVHHELLMRKAQECFERPKGRLMVFMPPGSAKSTYGSVVLPAFVMGAYPGSKVISTSYGSDLARKMGRRTRSIVKQPKYGPLFDAYISQESSAADEWALTNGSEYMSGGILSGITGNRANLLTVDDPIKGREEAESQTIRKKVREAFDDDLMSRLLPGGSAIIIQTRWHEDDLAGSILPENYNGESGFIECRDGETWEVICLPAKAERSDDLLGRKVGDYIWPEWFPVDHWQRFERNPRTWASLYQQRPAPDEGAYFKREWFKFYGTRPEHLRIYGASDYAVSDGEGDYTVHIVVGIDQFDNIYILDIWRGQTTSDVWVEAFIDLVERWKPLTWAEEQGQIIKSLGPYIVKRMRERRVFCHREQFASVTDKVTRARSFQARASMGNVYLPGIAEWKEPLLNELLTFPVGRNDDQIDPLGLIGRMLDTMAPGHVTDTNKQNRNDYASIGSANAGDDAWML